MRAVAIDSTDELASQRCLVLAPHPDDETLGCGATLARMRSLGTQVHVAFLSGGGQSPRPDGVSVGNLLSTRRLEASCALDVLGVDKAHTKHLDYPDGSMSSLHGALVSCIADLVQWASPEVVLVTSAQDRHPDHVAVAMAARSVLSRRCCTMTLYEYGIWQRVPALAIAGNLLSVGPRRPQRSGARALVRPRIVQTGAFINKKQAALLQYKSQIPHFPVGFVNDFLGPFEPYVRIVSKH